MNQERYEEFYKCISASMNHLGYDEWIVMAWKHSDPTDRFAHMGPEDRISIRAIITNLLAMALMLIENPIAKLHHGATEDKSGLH